VNKHVKGLIENIFKATHKVTTPYSKQENSLVERVNKEVGRHLANCMLTLRTLQGWPKHLRAVQAIINNSPNESLGTSPAQLVYGGLVDIDSGKLTPHQSTTEVTDPTSEWVDIDSEEVTPQQSTPEVAEPNSEWVKDKLEQHMILRKKISENLQEHDQAHISKRQKAVTEFKIGTEVLVTTPDGGPSGKLQTRHKGPYTVAAVDKDEYTMQDMNHPSRTMRAHVTRLREFKYDARNTIPKDVALADTGEFLVESVLAHRGAKKLTRRTRLTNLQFLVKWQGFDDKSNSWEPWKGMKDVAATHEYLTSIGAEFLIPQKFEE
jgi:hypothetical protein